jgi:DNA-binding CsgD family transcriptional regulator
VAHIGNAHSTVCGFIFTSAFTVLDAVPVDRSLCRRCAERAEVAATGGSIGRRLTARDAAIVELLKQGLDNVGVARRLKLGMRTTVRYINDAMRRADARSRFQWGYLLGFEAGRDAVGGKTAPPQATTRDE